MKHLFLIPILTLFFTGPIAEKEAPRVAIYCAPTEVKNVFAATDFSVRDGNWFDRSTWASGRVPAEEDNVTTSHNIWSTQLIKIRGQYTASKGSLEFRGINENNMVGSNMDDVRASDVGLAVLGAGRLNLQGDYVNPFTDARTNVLKGSTSITVMDATGWKVGHEIVVNPSTAVPRKIADLSSDESDFNRDNAGNPVDPFAANFERRTITAVSGNTVSFAQPLLYDHSAVDVHGTVYPAIIANLSRSFEIRGTKTGYSHVFIHSSQPQIIKNIALRYMGPRKNNQIISGLYALHQHHSGYGAAGTIIEGVSIYDGRSRGYVTHVSHGVTIRKSTTFNLYGASAWWDQGDRTHLAKYHDMLFMLQTNDGVNSSESMVLFGQGDGNEAVNIIGIRGDKPKGAVFAWEADNEAAWVTNQLRTNSSRVGIEWWQNTPHKDHVVNDYVSYNMARFAISHGAYGNSVRYNRAVIQNANVQIQASSSYTLGMALDNSWMNNAKLIVHGSAIPSPYPNMFRSDTMVGNSVVEMYTPEGDEHVKYKITAFINCVGMKYTFNPKSGYGSQFYVQEKGSARYIKQSGTTSTSILYPDNYGTGDGLKATYYNGSNFNSLAWEQIEPVPAIAQASIDPYVSPDGLDHRITDKSKYSVRYEGLLEPHFTGQHSFRLHGAQGFRLWVDNKLILDDWTEHGDTKYNKTSSQIALTKGQKYAFKLETFNSQPPYELHTMWLQNGQYVDIPQSQLYSKGIITPPPPPVNQPPVVNLGADQIKVWSDTTARIDGTASDPDGSIDKYTWSQVSGAAARIENNLSDAADARITGLSSGVYTFRLTVTDNKGATASDEIQITVNSKPIDTTAPVDPCKTFIEADYLGLNPDIAAAVKSGRFKSGLEHYNDWGKTEKRKINKACVGPVVFKNIALTQSVNCLDGTVRSHTVPAGKYTAASQSAADALALQEINTELAKCPKPLFELKDGTKIIYIFKEGETYKLIVK